MQIFRQKKIVLSQICVKVPAKEERALTDLTNGWREKRQQRELR